MNTLGMSCRRAWACYMSCQESGSYTNFQMDRTVMNWMGMSIRMAGRQRFTPHAICRLQHNIVDVQSKILRWRRGSSIPGLRYQSYFPDLKVITSVLITLTIHLISTQISLICSHYHTPVIVLKFRYIYSVHHQRAFSLIRTTQGIHHSTSRPLDYDCQASCFTALLPDTNISTIQLA